MEITGIPRPRSDDLPGRVDGSVRSTRAQPFGRARRGKHRVGRGNIVRIPLGRGLCTFPDLTAEADEVGEVVRSERVEALDRHRGEPAFMEDVVERPTHPPCVGVPGRDVAVAPSWVDQPRQSRHALDRDLPRRGVEVAGENAGLDSRPQHVRRRVELGIPSACGLPGLRGL